MQDFRIKTERYLLVAFYALLISFLATSFSTVPVSAESVDGSVLRISSAAKLPVTKNVTVGLNKSLLIELPTDVRDVLVSNPKILDAVVHTSRRAYLIGMEMGQANAFFFDKNGRQILTLEVSIERDLTGMEDMLSRFIPGSSIKAEMINDNVVLTGHATNPVDASRAADIAGRFVKGKENVLNMIAVEAKEQVLLKVTVAEMQRDALKRLGIDIRNALFTTGNFTFSKIIENAFPVTSNLAKHTFLNGTGLIGTGSGSAFASQFNTGNQTLTTVMEALESTGLIRTLAEPNLTSVSGETASFLAGGEFPIPVAVDDGTITVSWKPFGVGVSFTPVVLTAGRINMKISTEVSELTQEGAVSLGSLSISGLKVRRAESTVEIPSGGALVMAGLISTETRQNLEGVPGLKDLPILGTLFRSRDFRNRETELVVIVTPFIVKAVASNQLSTPDAGFAPASDDKANLLGQLNRVYGKAHDAVPVGSYKGDYGFIVE